MCAESKKYEVVELYKSKPQTEVQVEIARKLAKGCFCYVLVRLYPDDQTKRKIDCKKIKYLLYLVE